MGALDPFTALGLRTTAPEPEILRRLVPIKALLFDRVGLLNDGWKDARSYQVLFPPYCGTSEIPVIGRSITLRIISIPWTT